VAGECHSAAVIMSCASEGARTDAANCCSAYNCNARTCVMLRAQHVAYVAVSGTRAKTIAFIRHARRCQLSADTVTFLGGWVRFERYASAW